MEKLGENENLFINGYYLNELLRIKQIEDNKGETLVSEGLDANYYDIINYAVFALIRLLIEKKKKFNIIFFNTKK